MIKTNPTEPKEDGLTALDIALKGEEEVRPPYAALIEKMIKTNPTEPKEDGLTALDIALKREKTVRPYDEKLFLAFNKVAELNPTKKDIEPPLNKTTIRPPSPK